MDASSHVHRLLLARFILEKCGGSDPDVPVAEVRRRATAPESVVALQSALGLPEPSDALLELEATPMWTRPDFVNDLRRLGMGITATARDVERAPTETILVHPP
jgi:hypothetical protein